MNLAFRLAWKVSSKFPSKSQIKRWTTQYLMWSTRYLAWREAVCHGHQFCLSKYGGRAAHTPPDFYKVQVMALRPSSKLILQNEGNLLDNHISCIL